MTQKLSEKNSLKASAHIRNLRIAPSKINKILKQIRGKKYLDALNILKNIPQKSGSAIWKVLYSAVCNAQNTVFSLSKKKLFVAETYVNQSSILKRMRPRAKGKAYKIEKKLCHVSVFVKELI